MPIVVTLDVMLARRKMRAKDLAARIGISETQLSLFRSGKVRGLRFETLAKLCLVLECTPGDLLDYTPDPADLTVGGIGSAATEEP
ncbi:MAG: helix-turn-helix transcriptional regulator [Myxococcota bacterium]